ncbi:MAG: hypothetical protein H6757_05945 [Candidatus Omnitrophica bacterium]|nr:hypothetical protein [Candidatus Omnitrophota bacterium]
MSLLKNKNQESKLPQNWSVVLTGPIRNDLKDQVVEKISSAFSIPFNEASEMVINLPIILLDGLSQPSAVKLKDFLRVSGAEFFLTDDEKVKRKCYRAVWPDPPRISFLPELEELTEETPEGDVPNSGPDKLIRRIQNLEQIKKTLGQSINEKGRELNVWRSKHKDLEDKLNKLQQDFSHQKEQFQKAETENAELSENQNRLEQALKEKEKRIHELTRTLENDEKKHTKEISSHKEALTRLEKNLDHTHVEAEELKLKKEELEQSLRQKAQESAVWEARAQDYQEEIERLKSKSAQSERQSHEDLRSIGLQYERLSVSKKEIETQCANLQSSLQDQTSRYQQLETESLQMKSELHERVRTLETEVENWSGRFQAVSEELAKTSSSYAQEKGLRENLEEIRSVLERERLEIEQAFNRFKEESKAAEQILNQRCQRSDDRIKELENEKTLLLEEGRVKEDSIIQNNQEIAGLRLEAEKLQQQSAELQRQFQEESDLRHKYEKSKNVLAQDKKELETLLQDKNAAFLSLSEKYSELQASGEQLQSVLENTRNALQQKLMDSAHEAASWKAKAEEQGDRFNLLEGLKNKTEEELKEVHGKLESLQNDLRSLETANANLQSQIDVQQVQIKEGSERERQLEETSHTLKALLHQHQESSQKREHLLIEKSGRQDSEIKELAETKERLLDQMDHSQHQLEETRGHLHELSVRFEGVEAEKEKLAEALRGEREALASERSSKEELLSRLNELEQEKDALSRKMTQEAQRCETLQDHLRQLETEREQVREAGRQREQELEGEAGQLKAQIHEMLGQIERLNEVRDELERLSGEKMRELEENTSARQNLESQLAETLKNLQEETGRVRDLQMTVEALRGEVSEKQSAHDDLVGRLSDDLTESRENTSRLSEELEYIRNKYEEDRKSFEELDHEFRDVHAAKKVLDGVIKDQKETIEALTSKQSEDVQRWAEEKNNLLQDQEALRESYDQVRMETGRLSGELEKAACRIDELIKLEESLKQEIRLAEDTRSDLEKQLQETTAAIAARDEVLTHERQQFEQSLEQETQKSLKLQEIIDEWVVKHANLEAQLQTAFQEQKHAHEQHEQLQSAHDALLQRLEKEQVRIEQLEAHYIQANQGWRKKEGEWESEKAKLFEELENTAEQLDLSKTQCNETEIKIQHLEERLREEEQRFVALEGEKAAIEQARHHEHEKSQSQLSGLSDELETARGQIENLSAKLGEANEKIQSLEDTSQTQRDEQETLQSQYDALLETRQSLEERLREEEQRFATFDAEQKNLGQQRQEQYEVLQKQYKDLIDQRDQLQSRIDHSDQTQAELKNRLNDMEELLRVGQEDWDSERVILETQIAEAQSEISRIRDEKERLERLFGDEQLNRSRIEEGMANLVSEKAQLDQTIERLTEKACLLDAVQSEKHSLWEENEKLQAQSRDFCEKLEKMQAEYQTIEQSYQSQTTAFDDLKQRWDALAESKKLLEVSLNEERAKNGQLVTAYTNVQQEHAKVRTLVKDFERQAGEWKEKAETATRELSALTAQWEERAVTVQEQKEKITHLEEIYEELTSRFAHLEKDFEGEKEAHHKLQKVHTQMSAAKEKVELALVKEQQSLEELRLKIKEIEEKQNREATENIEIRTTLENRLQEAEETIGGLEEERKNIIERSDKLSEAKAELEIELHRHAQELETYRSETGRYAGDLEMLRDQLETEKRHASENREKFAAADQNLKIVQQQLDEEQTKTKDLQTALEDACSRLKELEEKYRTLDQRQETERREFEERLQREVSALEHQLNQTAASLDEWQKTAEQKTAEGTEFKTLCKQLESALKAEKQGHQQLDEEFENLKKLWGDERDQLCQDKKYSQEHIIELEDTLAGLKRQADESSIQAAENDRFRQELEKQILGYQTRLKQSASEVEAIQDQLGQMDANLEKERGERTVLCNQYEHLQEEVRRLHQELEAQTSRESEKSGLIEKLKKQNEELLAKTPVLQRELEQQIAQAQSDLENWQHEADTLNQRLAQLEGVRKNLEQQLQDKQHEIEQGQNWHQELNQQIAVTEARLEEEKAEHLKTRGRYDEVLLANESRFEETLNKERSLWESKFREINEQCRELEQMKETLNQKTLEQAREIEGWRMQCEKMSLRIESMQEEHEQGKQEQVKAFTPLQNKLDEVQQQRKHLEEEYLKSRKTFAEKLQQSLHESEKWKNAAETLNQQVKSLEDKKTSLEQNLFEFEKEKSRLESEIQEHARQYKELEEDFHKARMVFQRKFEEFVEGGQNSEDMLQTIQEQNLSFANERKRFEEALAAHKETEKNIEQRYKKNLEDLTEQVFRNQQELGMWQKKSKDLASQCKALTEDRDRLGMELQSRIQEAKQWQIRFQDTEKRFDQLKASHDNLEKMVISRHPKEH